jgi:large subunit ribosomal protein L17
MKSLIVHGSIKTTKAKAVATRSEIEKLITKAKKGTDASKRDVYAHLPDKQSVALLLSMAETRFSGRTSGYTRITKIGKRRGDASEQVLFSFVDEEVKVEVIKPGKKETAKPAKNAEKPKKEVKKSTKTKETTSGKKK